MGSTLSCRPGSPSRPVLRGNRDRSGPLLRPDGCPADAGQQAVAHPLATCRLGRVHVSSRCRLRLHGGAAGLRRPLRRPRGGRRGIQCPASPRFAAGGRNLCRSGAATAWNYNFSGDLGKAAIPAVVALLLPILAWRPVVGLLALLGLGVTLALLDAEPARNVGRPVGGAGLPWRKGSFRLRLADDDRRLRYGDTHGLSALSPVSHPRPRGSFGLRWSRPIVALHRRRTREGDLRLAWRAAGRRSRCHRNRDRHSAADHRPLLTPLAATLVLLPLLGIVLNGTSSVLYGTVPELAPAGDAGRAFALFYTGVISSGGLAPIAYGVIADHSSQTVGVLAAAATAILIVPMALRLGPIADARVGLPSYQVRARGTGRDPTRHAAEQVDHACAEV